MKTSESPQSVKTARRRSAVSFAAAVALYLPVIAFVFYAAPVLTYKAAGNEASVALSSAQVAGGAVSQARAESVPPEPEPEPEPVKQPEPEPEVKTPDPEPVPVVKPKPVVKKVVEKPKPKPRIKPRPEKTKAVKTVQPKPAETVKKAEKPAEEKHTAAVAAPVAGAQSAFDAGGISTLVYGKTDDPFLARVKRAVESVLHYPRKARVMRLQGVTIVQFVIAADGSLTELELFETSPHGILDKAALRAVKEAQGAWGSPAKTVRLRFPIRFELRG